MEGVRLTVNKSLSNHFPVNHTVALGTIRESNYHFRVTYVGTEQLSPTEAFPGLVGDMDNSGNLNAQVIHQLGPALGPRRPSRPSSQFVNWQVDGEYGVLTSQQLSLSGTQPSGGSKNPRGPRPPKHPLGGELVYPPRPGEEGTVTSPTGKYMWNWLATVTLGQAGMHGTYYHKASGQLHVGVEFEASTRMQDMSVSFGYQLDLPKANTFSKAPWTAPGSWAPRRRRTARPCP
ncbi:Mitochondrial import receptor subunit TOM40 like protein [Myotis davidii]|uniref:Mitochondrial import receptor subunit TOM40 like protein n=1 Tax=Myotis davidii TaxID=225400 RepID=L5MFH3_MYODS|nr:Mitochondrial import receptor subunit TOM40 like protein [Myotis davidii]